MSKKLTKEEVKKPDAFIHYTDKLIEWIERHGKILTMVLAFIVLAGASYVLFNKYQQYNEVSAQESLYHLRVELEKLNEKFKAKDEKTKSTKVNKDTTQDAPDEESTKLPKDFTEHFLAIIAKYKEFINEHPGTGAQSAAYIQLAHLYAENKKWSEVSELLTQPLNQLKKESFYHGLMAMLKSQALMNQEKYNEATAILEGVSGQDQQKHLHAESLLRIGLCYEKLEDFVKAKQYFERVSREFEESEAANLAKNYLRYLALKEKA